MSEAQAQGPVASMGQGHTKDLRLESLNQAPQALCPPCPGLSNLVYAGRPRPGRFRIPPEARGAPPLGGCHGDGAVYQLVAARHRRRMELSCEVRDPRWVPRN